MVFIFIILMAIIIVQYRSNSDLKEEIEKLKKDMWYYCPHCGKELKNKLSHNNVLSNDKTCFNKNDNVFEEAYDKSLYEGNIGSNFQKKNNYTDKEIKNSIILITGAVLVILSAIIFLTSTWDTTLNIVKTIVIILMLFVFLIASNIAEKVLKLKQTATAFYYIALSYLPIALMSISLFGLFGKFFSIYGLGRYIYLSFCSGLISYIYYQVSLKRKSVFLVSASVLFQLLMIGFLVLIFTNQISLILIGIILYNLLLHYMYHIHKYLYNDKVHLKIINVITISVGVLILYFNLFWYIDCSFYISDLIIMILMFFNLFYSLVLINKRSDIYQFIYPVATILIFFHIANLNAFHFSFLIKQLFIICSFLILYIYDLYKFGKIKITSFSWISVSAITLYYVSLFHFYDYCLNGYVISGIYTILAILDFIYFDKYREVVAYLISILGIFTMFNIVNFYDLSYLWMMGISLILFVIPMFGNKLNYFLRDSFRKVGNIGIIISMVMVLFEGNYNMYLLFVMCLLCFGIYLLYSLYKDITWYKILSYIFLNISLISMVDIINIDSIYRYIIPITTVIIIFLEYFIPKLRDNYNYYYIILQFVLSFIILNFDIDIYSFLFIILLNVSLRCYKQNKSDAIYYLSAISLAPGIYDSNLLRIGNIHLMYFISIMLISFLLYLSYYKKNVNVYTKIVYGYVLLHIMMFDNNKYVALGIFMFVSGIHYLSNDKGWKDVFKFLLYSSGFILYTFLIDDIGIYDYTLFRIGGYLIFSIIVTRTILDKYVDDYKILEYILTILINFIAIGGYISEYDGMLFVSLLVILAIVGYLYKMGPIFLVSICFVLLNVFLLTRNFWLSIPWWLYILFIGSILIAFAIYNELNDKKEKNMKEKILELKKELDL